ncbi:RNA-binding domain-containing protein [Candidatus Poriferisodalis sp.]|uniref:RNA-binding domain-containing protein n=1 Tax=Candidatus Poriferisodalis sp. TaxID=3101277 RepID=UPI003B01F9A4
MPDRAFTFLPPPSHDAEIERVLNALAAGSTNPGELETEGVDLKEEASRRAGSEVLPGQPRDERVAKQLAAEAACFANTRGGGVIIVGVDDRTGELIGAVSDTDWLRTRLYQLTDSKVTVDIREAEVKGSRLLVIVVPQAVEPVPFERKYQHRRGAACVPVTSTQLLQGLFAGVAADPSHRESGMKVDETSDSAFRSLLRRAAVLDSRRSSLSRRDLLARLGLLYGDTDSLNHAGEILLGSRAFPALDYTYRRVPGGPSLARVCEGGLSLLEELDLVEAEYTRRNPFRELTLGLAVIRVHAIPERTLREAILNGVCHRDWHQHEPTVVEHIGHELRVTSPGGLMGDVSVDNIITHPSLPRYRTLMNAVRQLGLVEQEGTGVDRMVADLIRVGSEPPLIEATEQPAVRVVLRGCPVDVGRFQFFAGLRMPSEDQGMPPEPASDDVDAALLVWRAMNPETAFLTAHSCAPLLQRTPADTTQVLRRVASYRTADDRPLLARVPVPDGTPPAWHLSRGARSGLRAPRVLPATATAWVRERKRISSAEYSAIASVSQPTANSHLRDLAKAEGLVPSRPSGRGPGFHYLYAESTERSDQQQ